MIETPELDKLIAVKEQSQKLGCFLEWLFSNGQVLCTYKESRYYDEDGNVTDEHVVGGYCDPGGYYQVGKGIEQILAEYFGIDLEKVNEEKSVILDDYRKSNEQIMK